MPFVSKGTERASLPSHDCNRRPRDGGLASWTSSVIKQYHAKILWETSMDIVFSNLDISDQNLHLISGRSTFASDHRKPYPTATRRRDLNL